MTDEAKAVEIAEKYAERPLLTYYGPSVMILARSFLALSEKYRVLKDAANAGLSAMKCDWLGHQDNVCPKCVLQYVLDELEPGDSQ